MASNLPQEMGNKEIFDMISKELPMSKWFEFGQKLGLKSNTLESLDRDATLYHYGQEYKTILMMEKWKQEISPNDEKVVDLLTEALKNSKCTELANKVKNGLS